MPLTSIRAAWGVSPSVQFCWLQKEWSTVSLNLLASAAGAGWTNAQPANAVTLMLLRNMRKLSVGIICPPHCSHTKGNLMIARNRTLSISDATFLTMARDVSQELPQPRLQMAGAARIEPVTASV